jgi:predicted metal-dependent hydrolase
MSDTLRLGDIEVDVVLKDIKNVHLSVYPPNGHVRIAAPAHMNLDTIRAFAISKLGWIKTQQEKLAAQPREPARIYIDRESHYLWGERLLLKLVERSTPEEIHVAHRSLILQVRPGATVKQKHERVARWYRDQVRARTPELIAKWEPVLQVKVNQFFVQKMKTRWGSCNPKTGNLRLNSELAKKAPECLEYIVVHEMVHLLEPTHNDRFKKLMDDFMPHWRAHRDALNQTPLSHQDWIY